MTRVLVVTNDFPPRPGGIQSFVHGMVSRFPPDAVVVYASTWRDPAAFDAEQGFPVVRDPSSVLLPTPRVVRRVREVAAAEGCTSVWFGAAAPLGLMAPALRRFGIDVAVASTHGHEAGWATLPGARRLLRRVGDGVDALTCLGDYTRRRIAPALSPVAAARMVRLPPGVDDTVFRPDADGGETRAALGLADRPVVVCVSRLVPRKGQDVLVRALPSILRRVPEAALLLVGDGPHRGAVERLVDTLGLRRSVLLTGSVPWPRLPAYFAAGDVFAMPCRTRRHGLDVEGLGIVYLEASATALPVVAGNSGGAPDTVLDGETGHVVDGRSVAAVAERISGLLLDPSRATSMGERGRRWVAENWRWSELSGRLQGLLGVQ